MVTCLRWSCGLAVSTSLLVSWLTVLASPPVKLSEVATVDDLEAEVDARLTDIERALNSAESYREHLDSLKRSATQLAICGQALAEHDSKSRLKESGPDLRDTAFVMARSRSRDEALAVLPELKAAARGEAGGTAKVAYDWGQLARLGAVMSAMKSRSESLRRAMRKPGDSAEDSRHATAIALLALVAHGNTVAVKESADRPRWRELSLEVQKHFTQTAQALNAKDPSTAADHFRLGMEACNTCHEMFKP